MSDWPCWLPGMELRADHLLRLEDYLLAPGRLTDTSYGVIDFNWREILVSYSESDVWNISIEKLKGLTPSRQPVQIDPDHSLTITIPEENEFDLWVSVNAETQEDDAGKLQLEANYDRIETSVIPAHRPNHLHLGRFVCFDGNLELVEHPIPIRVCRIQAPR